MNAIEVKSICKHRKDFLLDHVAFTLPEGTILGLIGENGAGKTTTLRLLGGQLSADEGEISLLGQKPFDPALKSLLGIVPDDAGLSPCITPLQFGKILGGIYPNWQENVYRGYLSRLEVPTEKAFGEMSLGTKKKLAIAAALSHDPRILLLDEACSGLDPVARAQVLEILFDFTRREDRTVVISSHIVSDLEKLCDYIAFMHKGKLILFEEKDALYETYGLLRCSAETLNALPAGAVLGKRTTEYGVQALVRRALVPAEREVSPVSLEDIFVFMVKEDK